MDIHEKSNWEFNQLSFKWIEDSSNRRVGYEISDNNVGIVIDESEDVLDEPSVRILTELNAGSNSKEETRETKDRRENPLTI